MDSSQVICNSFNRTSVGGSKKAGQNGNKKAALTFGFNVAPKKNDRHGGHGGCFMCPFSRTNTTQLIKFQLSSTLRSTGLIHIPGTSPCQSFAFVGLTRTCYSTSRTAIHTGIRSQSPPAQRYSANARQVRSNAMLVGPPTSDGPSLKKNK
jgi:hypothetical protein